MMVNKAIQKENDEEERLKKLDRFKTQPKRGTSRKEEPAIEKVARVSKVTPKPNVGSVE